MRACPGAHPTYKINVLRVKQISKMATPRLQVSSRRHNLEINLIMPLSMWQSLWLDTTCKLCLYTSFHYTFLAAVALYPSASRTGSPARPH